MRDEGIQVHAARSQERVHLVPGVIHDPAVYALEGNSGEDYLACQVKGNRFGRNAEQCEPATIPKASSEDRSPDSTRLRMSRIQSMLPELVVEHADQVGHGHAALRH